MTTSRIKAERFVRLCVLMALGGILIGAGSAQETSQPAGRAEIAKAVGTIKSISGNNVAISGDSGSPMTLVVLDSTRILRTEPGAKDLKGATPITAQELQVGDRVLARGKTAEDGKSLMAASIILIKASDVAAKQQQEREDWQKRGTDGLVTAVDPGAGTITISKSTIGGNKVTIVRVSKNTIVRRYAPNSVNFDEAMSGTFDQIKIGDQLHARGERSADGNQVDAEEIVSGTFRNIVGTVISTDTGDDSVVVRDLSNKQSVTLKLNPHSQLRNLPPMVAQRIAARLKRDRGGAQNAITAQSAPPEAKPGEPSPANGANRHTSGGAPDFQQMLNRMPAVTLAELQKGTAVYILATEGSANTQPTAITLLTGVEDILTASPDSTRAAMLLSPWNLGGMDAAAANQ